MPKQIVITGVSRGLGLAMVEGFIEHGHVVHGCGRSEAAIDSLRKRFGPPCTFHTVDVSNDNAVAAWANHVFAALEHSGRIDLLLNNAAIINRNAPLWEVPAGEFDQVIDVNIKGVANVVRHFAPRMIQCKHGVIVNFSSGWGRSVSAEVAPYCATKWAIEGLTKALADELPVGMAAIPLNPGIINTDMLQSCFGENASSYPDARQWAAQAVPFLLRLGPRENGQSLSAPT